MDLHQAQRSNNLREDEALAWIRQQTQSSDFKTSIDRATTESLNHSYASFTGASLSTSDKTAQIFASTQSFTDSARTARSDTASLERSAEQSERTAQVLRGQHGAAFIAFAGDHLRSTPDGFHRSNDDIGRVLQGRSVEDRQLLYEAADTFASRYLPANDAPKLLTDNMAAVGEPTAAHDLREGPGTPLALGGRVEPPPGRAGPTSRYGSSGTVDVEALREHAQAAGLRVPSKDRDLAPDPALITAGGDLGGSVDEHLGKRPRRIDKDDR
jgi:hypothetical protein